MRKSVLLTSLFIGLIMVACVSSEAYAPPVFPVIKQMDSKRLSEGLVLHYPFDMCIDGDNLFVLALAEKTWLQVYNKKTGAYVGSFISKGQGPGEIVTGTMLHYDASRRSIAIYDETSVKLLTYSIGDDLENLLILDSEKSFYMLDGIVRRVWPLDNSCYLVDGQLGGKLGEQKRFQLLSHDEVTYEFNEYSVTSEEEKLAFLSPGIALSPDKGKMAVGTLYGGILELYDISEKLSLKDIRRFYPPILRYSSGAIRSTEETIWGFSTLCATSSNLYTVLIGGKDPNLLNNISVFNWNGEEQIRYETDCSVFRLCSSEEEPDKLYGIAVSDDKEFYLVSFDLK